jgi:hypothetical protein
MSADQSPSEDLLVRGDYYQGAFGPSIILVLSSPQAARWLQGIFRSTTALSSPLSLSTDPHVRLNNVDDLSLVHRTSGSEVELRREPSRDLVGFVLSATEQGWQYLADLMEPLAEGQTGHQYLTREGVDDALIEVSLGEQHARDKG